MNNMQWGFVFVQENCIQCHACEVACKNWRFTEGNVKWRRVENLWNGSYPQVSSSTMSISCMHCVNPTCVEVCPTNAIRKRPEDGVVLVDSELCIGCKACLQACPFQVPQFGADGVMQKCDMCLTEGKVSEAGNPPCVRTCPTKALELRQMSVEEKLEMEKTMLKDMKEIMKKQ